MLVIGALALAYVALFLARSRLLVGLDDFGYQDALGRRHLWSAAQVGSIVDVTIAATKNAPSRRLVYFLGLDGRRLMLINPAPWPDSTIDRLARAAGKPVEVRQTPMTAAAFRREFPSAISWASAHSTLTGTLLAVGLIALVIGIAIATIWLHP